MLEKKLKTRLDEKLEIVQKLRPLPPASVAKLKEQFSVEMTYNSNAIEGNRLTLKETFLVISEGITVKGKPLKDHLEAKDHFEAIQYLYELIEHDKRHTVSEHLIRSLQSLVVRETESSAAGRYRDSDVRITGSKHQPPDAFEVPKLMRDLVIWMRAETTKIHPVEFAAYAHHRLVYIHPFFDGNGRTARLLMNLTLMQSGFPLGVILKNDRKKYYDALEKADSGDLSGITRLIGQAVERSLDLYIKTLMPSRGAKGKFLSLSEIASQISYSAKYLNLLVRQGKLAAHKEGRNWVATLDAVSEYKAGRERKRRKQVK